MTRPINGWKTWLAAALFTVVLGLVGTVWSAQSKAIDEKVGIPEHEGFKALVIYRLDSIDKKLDRLLRRLK